MAEFPEATVVLAEPAREGLEPIDFARLFTVPERIAMRGSADEVVKDFLWMLDRANRVYLDHPDTRAGLDYMVHVAGLLTEERAEQVRRGEPPPAPQMQER